jgi:hypothetical protein
MLLGKEPPYKYRDCWVRFEREYVQVLRYYRSRGYCGDNNVLQYYQGVIVQVDPDSTATDTRA